MGIISLPAAGIDRTRGSCREGACRAGAAAGAPEAKVDGDGGRMFAAVSSRRMGMPYQAR